MVKEHLDRIHELIADPTVTTADDLPMIESAVEKYPYFQSLRAVYLKSLKNFDSPVYNRELKRTAVHTTDRGVLFDYITSKDFLKSNGIDSPTPPEVEAESESGQNNQPARFEDLNASSDFSQVTDDDLFLKKEVETPFEFTAGESHSFSEWLKLTTVKPLQPAIKEKIQNTTSNLQDKLRQECMEKIDQFLEEQPKIKPSKDKSVSVETPAVQSTENQLMTETLARVYIAQKNFSKAIKAYEIMALQHPEKSGFFADRIREIKNLQRNQ